MTRTIYECSDGYYACIKKYGDDETYEDWFLETDREEAIYDKVMDLNGNDHDEAAGTDMLMSYSEKRICRMATI